MRAMILAAGWGTRLRPLTDDRPKALVEINGQTLLAITLGRLKRFGIREVVINAHHFADKLAEYVSSHDFGMRIEISREEELLDTGGGLKKVAGFFLAEPEEPFLLHNVDVLSSIDLDRMIESHRGRNALATLAVQRRETTRQLLFDDDLQLCGRVSGGEKLEMVRPGAGPQPLAFCGIHVISPKLFELLTEEGVFSIITSYVRLAQQGERILGFRADEYYWRDVGRPDSIRQAADDFRRGVIRG